MPTPRNPARFTTSLISWLPLLWLLAAHSPFALGEDLYPAGQTITGTNVNGTEKSTIYLRGLKAPVAVVTDTYGIPHIYATSTEDAHYALGYLHATERIFQLELFRRRASGTLAEILGKSALEDDILMRQLGIRHSTQAAWEGQLLDAQLKQEVVAYCAGVNARLDELEARGFPEPLRSLGLKPGRWTPVDAMVFEKYMGWDQSGTDTDVWMGMLIKKLGLATVEELFPLDRPYEIPTVPADARGAQLTPILPASPLRMSKKDLRPVGIRAAFSLPVGFEEAARELHARFASGRMGSPSAFGSNNWVIDGKKSATGRPLLANDPHLGLSLPSIWYTAQLVAPGLNVVGVTFAGSPFVIIGHNDHMAWGFTNLQADAVDYFIERMDASHPHEYFYRGAWRKTVRRHERVAVRAQEPVTLEIESTLHGPLVTSHGVRLALDWTGLGPTPDVMALDRLNRATNLAEFKAALEYLAVPALNVVYADVDGNIAIAPHGLLPIRRKGNGRWPVDGSSGDYDWAGFIPQDKLPFALNPPEHYLASANGRPAPVGYPYYLGWMWDPSYRTRRIHELLQTHERIGIPEMEAFQMDAGDSAAEAFVPVLINAYDRKGSGDSQVKQAIEELRRWDFQASPESVACTIWSAWFEKFREAVWQDDFDAAGVERWSGSWGYAGSNQRQPELEVLEFLTRNIPTSPWFDDVRTPEKETRDDILMKSFTDTIRELSARRGADVRQWKWGKTNVLRLHSIANQPALDRGGMAVRGDDFTLCPGSNGGPVTGGASWRMVVDLGSLGSSVGVYPGGQTEDPSSAHYDDQVNPWVEGNYLPLYFYSSPREFPPEQVESVLTLEPLQ